LAQVWWILTRFFPPILPSVFRYILSGWFFLARPSLIGFDISSSILATSYDMN
jgi:hypothetical protein